MIQRPNVRNFYCVVTDTTQVFEARSIRHIHTYIFIQALKCGRSCYRSSGQSMLCFRGGRLIVGPKVFGLDEIERSCFMLYIRKLRPKEVK